MGPLGQLKPLSFVAVAAVLRHSPVDRQGPLQAVRRRDGPRVPPLLRKRGDLCADSAAPEGSGDGSGGREGSGRGNGLRVFRRR